MIGPVTGPRGPRAIIYPFARVLAPVPCQAFARVIGPVTGPRGPRAIIYPFARVLIPVPCQAFARVVDLSCLVQRVVELLLMVESVIIE